MMMADKSPGIQVDLDSVFKKLGQFVLTNDYLETLLNKSKAAQEAALKALTDGDADKAIEILRESLSVLK